MNLLIQSLDCSGLNQRIKAKKATFANMNPSDDNYSALSQEICFMWNLQRDKMWDSSEDSVLESNSFIPPSAFDVLLSDISHELLMGVISERLGVSYLTPPTEEKMNDEKNNPPINGILYGLNYRPMVNLIVASKRHNKWLNIVFLVDTGSPHLYLSENALVELGFNENIQQSFHILFRGRYFEASISPKFLDDGRKAHFPDINLIGSSFLRAAECRLDINYHALEVIMNF